MLNREEYMRIALTLAQEAYEESEVPVGCIIADRRGNIIGRGRNRCEKKLSVTAHAELEAIDDACSTLGDRRLDGCSLYVTLEPCPMCAGAIILSRLENVFYGAADELTGSCGSVINLFMESYVNKTRVTGGIMAHDCSVLISDFFSNLRGQNK